MKPALGRWPQTLLLRRGQPVSRRQQSSRQTWTCDLRKLTVGGRRDIHHGQWLRDTHKHTPHASRYGHKEHTEAWASVSARDVAWAAREAARQLHRPLERGLGSSAECTRPSNVKPGCFPGVKLAVGTPPGPGDLVAPHYRTLCWSRHGARLIDTGA